MLTGDEEQNRKQKKIKRNREWVPNPVTLDYSFVSYDDTMCRDHSVGLFFLPSHLIRKEKEEKIREKYIEKVND